MSLTGALNIGKSALAVHQAAIQVTSNNISNAGNSDYTRQTPVIAAKTDQQIRPGVFLGTGINLVDVQRNIDEALESRLRGSISDSQLADVRQQWLGRVESVFNELGDDDLSTRLSAFFNDWSNLANQPQDTGLRQVVVTDGQSLAQTFSSLRTSLGGLQTDIDNRLTSLARDANGLLNQIADLNGQIVRSEAGSGGTANGLRDNRDALLKKLSELMNIRTQDMGNGVVNVLAGSDPLVLGDVNRGVAYTTVADANGDLVPQLADATNGRTLNVTSGSFGALTGLRAEIGGVVDQVDSLAGNLIFELNKLHSEGQGAQGLTTATAGNPVADPTASLGSSAADLPFQITNGSFIVEIKSVQNNQVVQKTTNLITIDPNTTTLNSLATTLDGINGISASIAGGKLKIQSDNPQLQFSFAEDSSDLLAALGINSFFSGTTARDIAVNGDIKNNPGLIAAGKSGAAANQTALDIAKLETTALSALGGKSLKDSYEGMINGIAVSASSAKTNALSASAVQETLLNQREALSGVSIDEEAINLMKEQRAFQGAARVVSAIDELMKTLLSMV